MGAGFGKRRLYVGTTPCFPLRAQQTRWGSYGVCGGGGSELSLADKGDGWRGTQPVPAALGTLKAALRRPPFLPWNPTAGFYLVVSQGQL